MHRKVIESESVLLRELSQDDVEEIYNMSLEQGIRQFIPDQVYESIDHAKKTVEFLISQYTVEDRLQNAYVLGIVEKKNGKLIGHVGLSPVTYGIEIGYAVRDSHQKQGLASKSVSLMLEHAFSEFKLKEIYGIVEISNIASIRVLEKCGFSFIRQERSKKIYTINNQ